MSVIDDALNAFFKTYPIAPGTTVGVAVSGGADSLCLALHLASYAKRHRLKLSAATVDHKLRLESSDEARFVHCILSQHNIEHTTLVWSGPKPRTHLEEKAREKRYDLLKSWCREKDIQYLFLAHHAGDQAETFWARLARGSGVNGLSGMAAQSYRQEIILCRPFLAINKEDILTDLKQKKIQWVTDSMNADDSYERVRWRKRQSQLSAFGLTPEMIGKTTCRLNRVRQAMDFYTHRFEQALVDVDPRGYITISLSALNAVPLEIQLRVLLNGIKKISGIPLLSLDGVERWLDRRPKQMTLGGCVLLQQQGLLFIARELTRMEKSKAIPANQPTNWDRFRILSSCPVQI
ncbi:MAG: tRNA lysidine(34) synthetase TilS, partial [Alphaproteobacteria bacterium]|nr:tRNA lysidine(34) synthetase TilS [Alphaproteobacteria bacterium]